MPGRFQVIRGGQDARQAQRKTESQALPRSFGEVLVAHLDSLYALALRLVDKKREEAEDLVQEACLRAFKNYECLRSPEKFKSWFFRILVNTHINVFRHQRQVPPIIDIELNDALLDLMTVDPGRTPEEQLFEQLLDSEVQRALDSLPVEFRTVVWLADVEGMNYKEIAEIMSCRPGTVASRLFRGHSLLRERLREYARRRGLV